MREIRFSSRAKQITIWLAVAGLLFLLYRTAHLLSPFIWALVATYIFNPPVTYLTRRTHLPRFVWIILLYVVVIAAVVWGGMTLGPVVRDQTIALLRQAPEALHEADAFVKAHPLLRDLGVSLDLQTLEKEVVTRSNDIAEIVQRMALPIVAGAIDKLLKVLVFLVVTFYLLLNAEREYAFFIGLIPREHKREITDLLGRINQSLGAYLRSQLILIAIMSVATFIFLSAIRVEYPLVIAIATGVLEIIPFVGPYTAATIAIVASLFQPTTPFGWSHVTYALVIALGYFVLRQLEDNIVIPSLVGKVVNLNPVIVLFAVLAGASLYGFVGILLAVPAAAVLRIIIQYLYAKLVNPTPAHVLILESGDDPVEKVEEVAEYGFGRLVLVCRDANPALQDQMTYQQLAFLMAKYDFDLDLVSSDAIARGLAEAYGVRVLGHTVQ